MSGKPPRIFGWMGDRSGCGYYRIVQPLSQLNRDGLARAEWGTKLQRERVSTYRVIVGQRVTNPRASLMWQQLAREGNHLMVYELDDDLWRISPDNPASAAYNDNETRERLTENIRVANLVTVTTDPLARLVRRINRNVVVIPNWIDGELLGIPRPDGPDGPVSVGWAGSPTHQADLDHIRQPLARAIRSLDARVCFLGADYSRGLPAEKVQVLPWEPDMDRYYWRLSRFDMALAPLRPSAFNRSKSDLRAKELHALGIPAIYSAEPPYGTTVHDGVSGVVAGGSGDWRRCLKMLVSDPELRERLGAGARELARQWTIERHASERAAEYAKMLWGKPYDYR